MFDNLKIIDLNTRQSKERPKTYNSNTGKLQPISDALESFLILAENDLKNKLVSQYNSRSVAADKDISIRNKLRDEFTESRLNRYNADLSYYQDVIEVETALITEILSVRISESTPINSIELTEMIRDLQKKKLEEFSRVRYLKFLISVTEYVNVLDNHVKSSTSNSQRASNWPNILLAYNNIITN